MATAIFAVAITFSPRSANAAEFKPWSGINTSVELKLPDLDGNQVDLQKSKGKVVLVNFWASWCGPCRNEMPELEDIQRKYGEKGLEILSVNLGEAKPRIESFLKAWFPDGAPFRVVQDRNSLIYKRWQVSALPSSFLIDRQGKITWLAIGAIHLDDESTMQRIEALLQQDSTIARRPAQTLSTKNN